MPNLIHEEEDRQQESPIKAMPVLVRLLRRRQQLVSVSNTKKFVDYAEA
jgi:hypothetical protein